MKVLLTGFEPFGGETLNPSWEAVRRAAPGPGVELHRLLVPTEFGRSATVVTREMDRLCPDAIVCVGQAGGRAAVTPERVAINLDDARIADNAGAQPVDVPAVPGGPAAYFSTLPVRAITEALRAAGLPAELSQSAGTFVCNHLMYGVLHHAALYMPAVRAGFVHVPYLPEQLASGDTATPSLPLEKIVEALNVLLEVLARGTPAAPGRQDAGC